MGAHTAGDPGSMIIPALSMLAGLAAVSVLLALARRKDRATEVRWYAGGLVIAAGIYVAFGLVLGGPPLGFELIQLGTFTALAVAGLRRSPLFLSAGWLAHSAWDALHMLPGLSQHAPEWYVFACLAFDVPIAAYIFIRRSSFTPAEAPVAATAKTPHEE